MASSEAATGHLFLCGWKIMEEEEEEFLCDKYLDVKGIEQPFSSACNHILKAVYQ